MHEKYGGAVLAAQAVPRSEVEEYGAIEPKRVEERVYQVMRIVEKPTPSEAPYSLVQVGGFVLTPDIFSAIDEAQPGEAARSG